MVEDGIQRPSSFDMSVMGTRGTEEKRSNRGSCGVAEREELVRLGRDEAESA